MYLYYLDLPNLFPVDNVFAKKQPHHALHCFPSTFQISKYFWYRYLGKGQTRVTQRGKLNANFCHFLHIRLPGKSDVTYLLILVVLGVG